MRFISDSVLAGFTSASAVLISASQLKHLLGMHIPRYPDLPSTLYYVVTHLRSEAPVRSGSNSSGTSGTSGGGGHSNDGGGGGGVQIAALLTGIGGVLVLVGIQKFNKRFCKTVTLPEQLILLVLATLISWLAQLPKEQLPVVGVVPPGLPSPSAAVLGRWNFPMLLRLLQPAMVVAVVSFILSMSIVRIFALKFEYTTDPGVELLALGCAILLGASPHASAHHGAISPQVRSCSPSDAPFSWAPRRMQVLTTAPSPHRSGAARPRVRQYHRRLLSIVPRRRLALSLGHCRCDLRHELHANARSLHSSLRRSRAASAHRGLSTDAQGHPRVGRLHGRQGSL